MKISSRDLYKKMNEHLSVELKNRGYQRAKGGVLGWCKPCGNNYIVFWFQCDKWGWDESWGSSFTIEFQISSSKEIAAGSFTERERMTRMLGDHDLELMRQRNDAVIKSTDGFKQNFLKTMEMDGLIIPISGKMVSTEPYQRNCDYWFNYYTYDDVEFWSKFFVERVDLCETKIMQLKGAGH